MFEFKYGTVEGNTRQQGILFANIKKFSWFWNKESENLVTILNRLFEEVEVKLGYYPNDSQINIFLVSDIIDLNNTQKILYGKIKHKDAKAFMSKSRNTIYIAVEYVNQKILKHEIGHILFEKILQGKSPVGVSSEFHEHVAQYVES